MLMLLTMVFIYRMNNNGAKTQPYSFRCCYWIDKVESRMCTASPPTPPRGSFSLTHRPLWLQEVEPYCGGGRKGGLVQPVPHPCGFLSHTCTPPLAAMRALRHIAEERRKVDAQSMQSFFPLVLFSEETLNSCAISLTSDSLLGLLSLSRILFCILL